MRGVRYARRFPIAKVVSVVAWVALARIDASGGPWRLSESKSS